MIEITEYETYTKVSSPDRTAYFKRGLVTAGVSGGKYILSTRVPGTGSRVPAFSVNRIADVGTVTDKDGSTISAATLSELAEKTAQFFS